MEGPISSILPLVSSLSKSECPANMFAPAMVWFMFDTPVGICSQSFYKDDWELDKGLIIES